MSSSKIVKIDNLSHQVNPSTNVHIDSLMLTYTHIRRNTYQAVVILLIL